MPFLIFAESIKNHQFKTERTDGENFPENTLDVIIEQFSCNHTKNL